MTPNETLILRAALLAYEETANEVITDYMEEGPIADGGAELISLLSKAIERRFQTMCDGETDEVLRTWRKVAKH